MNYCRVIIIGNIVNVPDLKYIGENSTPVAEYSVAYSYRYKSKGEWVSEPAYMDAKTYGQQAERVANQFGKGDPVFVEGRLRTSSWKDRETGQSRSKTYLTTDLVLAPYGSGRPQSTAPVKHVPQVPVPASSGDHTPLSDDDIPF